MKRPLLAAATAVCLLFSTFCLAQAPPNDNCAAAQPIELGAVISGNSTNATLEFGEVAYADGADSDCGPRVNEIAGIFDRGVWYSFVAPDAPINVILMEDQFGFLPQLAIHPNDCFGLDCIASVTGPIFAGGAAITNLSLTAGETYLIFVDGAISAGGMFMIEACTEEVTCNDLEVQLDATGTASITAMEVAMATCDFTGITLSQSDFTCADQGEVVVTVTQPVDGDDPNTCTSTVTVLPAATNLECAESVTVELDETGNAELANDAALISFTDPCGNFNGPFTMGGPTFRDFNCDSVGMTFTRRLVFNPIGDGESVTCTYDVIVEDNLEPELLCETAVVVELDDTGNAELANDAALISFTDNCEDNYGGPFTVGGPDFRDFNCDSLGMTFTRRLVFNSKVGGAQVGCDYTVTVEDNIAPLVVGITTGSATLNNSGAAVLNVADFVTATDACGPITFSPATIELSCMDIGEIEVPVVARDGSGNETPFSLPIVTDFIQPVLTCITQINISLDEDCQATLVPAQVLTGNTACLDVFDFEIVVQDADPSNGPVIDGCGRFSYSIVSVGTDEIELDFDRCWGYVNAEDKTPPVVAADVPDQERICNKLEDYSIAKLEPTISKCYQVERDEEDPDGGFVTVAGTMEAELRMRLSLSMVANAAAIVPTFNDACTNLLEVCVQDQISYDEEDPDCSDVAVTRTFTATELEACKSPSGEQNASTTSSFDIIFVRPDLGDLEDEIAFTAEFSCDDPRVLDNDLAPRAEDYPFVVLDLADEDVALDTFYLGDDAGNAQLCNLAVSYEDGAIIPGTCDNSFKFVRTFNVIDWCEPDTVATFTQIVKVGDFDGPDLEVDFPDTLMTNAGNRCGAIIRLDQGITIDDNCSDPEDVHLLAEIYPGADLDGTPIGSFKVILDNNAAEVTTLIPVGTHAIVYTAIDGCGNVTESAALEFTVVDGTAPVAICEDGLNISLTNSNNVSLAVLDPHNIDAGSYDDCGAIRKEIARDVNGDGDFDDDGEEYRQEVLFTCDDLGEVAVSLLVIDNLGNANTCWLNVLIEDKTAPVCFQPADLTLTCEEYNSQLPNDITELSEAELDAFFGPVNAFDECEVNVEVEVAGEISSCGVGMITRSFTLTDGSGLTNSGSCIQTITIVGVHDYTVVFPEDEEAQCEIIPEFDGLAVDELACDLITVNTKVDTFRSLEAGEECFKLEVTYDVINWCEYNTLGQAYLIPRDGNLGLVGGIDRDPESELLYLHVIPRDTDMDDEDDADVRDDDFAFLSRYADRRFTPLAIGTNQDTIDYTLDDGDDGDDSFETDFVCFDGDNINDDNGADINDCEPYGTDNSRGFFRYVQFVKIYDDVAPVITGPDFDQCFAGAGVECEADLQITFTVTDECTLDLGLGNLFVELDPFYTVGAFGDDAIRLDSDEVTDNGDGTFTIDLEEIPVGEHAIRVQARDGCGNFDVETIEFCVSPSKAPTPICIQTLTVTLMPTDEGDGMAAIWASDFIASPVEDCFGNVIDNYAIYRDDEVPAAISPLDTGLVLTCADFSEDTPDVLVRVYAMDDEWNADYCQVNIDVQAFRTGLCDENEGASGTLAGTIATQDDALVAGVEVTLTGQNSMSDRLVTGEDGIYSFNRLPFGVDYTVQPAYNASVNLANVKTSDIIAVMGHILGNNQLEVMDMIAADVTQDGEVDIFDMAAIRLVILGKETGFTGGVSHRFVRADHDFADGAYAAIFPEVFNVNNLDRSLPTVDFYAIELGDVVRRTTGRAVSTLQVEDIDLQIGQTYSVALSTEAAGFQGTLELSPGLELIEVDFGALQPGHANLEHLADGLLGFSYNGDGADLLRLEVRATTTGKLSDFLRLSGRLVTPEGIDANGNSTDLNLAFQALDRPTRGPALLQNAPNPVIEATDIAFYLPAAGAATLTVTDQRGATVLVRQLQASAGDNFVKLRASDLGAAGVFNYTLTAGDFTATRKMIVLPR